MSKEFYVEIVSIEGDNVVKRIGPSSRHLAEKIEDSIFINLNHDEYYTQIVDKDANKVDYFW